MFEIFKGWWLTFKESISKYLMHYLIILGLFLYFVGRVLVHYNFNETTTELFLSVGKIILGTGFFTGLTKSNYYAKFFQDKIFNILYNPGNHFSDFEIKSKWLLLTNYMLAKKVKKHHSTASQVIFDRFLNPEHGYYYRNMTIDYDISLGADGKTLEIDQVMCMEIVFNDDDTEALLEQKISTDGNMELVQLIVDDKKEDHKKHYTPCSEDPKTMMFKKVIVNKDGSPVKVERTYRLKQNIHDEPYIISNYSKFIKGISVRYKASNCKVTFRQTGIINTSSNDVNVFDEENGYTRVVLASKDDLTLPGQGFILILSK